MSQPSPSSDTWKKCSTCKGPIPFQGKYWACNVSTCNRKRAAVAFCSVSCWDAHVPVMNHKDSWCEEKKAPTKEQWSREQTVVLKREG